MLILDVSFIIVPVHLFFLSQTSKEVSVVFCPSISLSVHHPLLSPVMVIWINELPGIKFLHSVEDSVKFSYGPFNVVPSLIEILSIRSRDVESMFGKLSINFLVCFMHCVELFMGFFEPFQFVGRVHKNSVCFIRVNMDVDIGGRNSLHVKVLSIIE